MKAERMTGKMVWMAACLMSLAASASAAELYVSPDGKAENAGSQSSPLDFQAALQKASDQLKAGSDVTINVLGGHYFFDKPYVLGPEFKGTEQKPIVIRAAKDAEVLFDGSKRIAPDSFQPVTDADEKTRLAASAVDKIVAATITDPALIARFKSKLMLSLTIDKNQYLTSVFPNDGYASFQRDAVTPEVCPPGVPVGKEGYGIRAGNPPHQEPGKPQSWKGSMKEPRGARAGFADKADQMAGTWTQWEAEIKRNNKRNQLTGFVEANWLLSSQPIYAASAADQCVHLSEALGYGWGWRKDKPFRVFGLLCELDQPGEWHFDVLTNRLYIYPPQPMTTDTVISLSVADGFMTLNNTAFVSVIGLSVKNVGSGSVYDINGGHHNLVAACTVSSSPAAGIRITGTDNGVKGCDLVDLNTHVSLAGGVRSPEEITPGRNYVENCHIYQKKYMHEKVNIPMNGVGNIFRNNLVHNSIGQAMTINGNDHLIELNEFFNVGFDEGDGGAMYAGADLTGYGCVYQYNFFHHLMHCPGKVERSGIHFDDLQAGSTCIGNIFYKSAAKGIHYNGGAGHTARYNVFLEGYRGIYNTASGGQKNYDRQQGIFENPDHMYANTKENYVGRAEKIVGEKGWTKSPWKDKYPLFCKVMSDEGQYGRMWPVYCRIENNFYYKNKEGDKTIWSRANEQVMKKNIIKNDRPISPDVFVDYDNLDLAFKEGAGAVPKIPFDKIGLYLDEYRHRMPDKQHYRKTVKQFFNGIDSMPGTTKKIDTAKVVEEGPVLTK